MSGAYSSRKGLSPWHGQCLQLCAGVPPLHPCVSTLGGAPYQKNIGGRLINPYQNGKDVEVLVIVNTAGSSLP